MLVTPEAHAQLKDLLKNRGLVPSITTNKDLNRILENAAHQGVAIEADPIFIHGINNISDIL